MANPLAPTISSLNARFAGRNAQRNAYYNAQLKEALAQQKLAQDMQRYNQLHQNALAQEQYKANLAQMAEQRKRQMAEQDAADRAEIISLNYGQPASTEEAMGPARPGEDLPTIEEPGTGMYAGVLPGSIEEQQLQAQQAMLTDPRVAMDDLSRDVMQKQLEANIAASQAGREAREKKVQAETAQQMIDLPQDIAASQSAISEIDRVRPLLAELYDRTNQVATGVGSIFAVLPESEANAWRELRDTVISNMAIDKIMEMKRESKTGATGFGQLNIEELKLLKTHLASLSQSQDPAVIKKRIEQINDVLVRNREVLANKRDSNIQFYNRNKQRYLGDPNLFREFSPTQRSFSRFQDMLKLRPENIGRFGAKPVDPRDPVGLFGP